MDYQIGRTGRVIAARLYEGEDIIEMIETLAQKERIHAAAVFITGGMRQGHVVVGPKQETPAIIPDERLFTGPAEVLGVGTLYPDDQGPRLHLHAGLGKGDRPVIGCIRGVVPAFLVLEVTIIELEGIQGKRELDEEKGVTLLHL
jgi:predicted DNA-binding protein with PD1-like motif